MLWFCPAFWWQDVHIYMLLLVVTSGPPSLLAASRASVIFFMVFMLHSNRFTSWA
jgi:hypothetical protein